jgi:hypothetical protein
MIYVGEHVNYKTFRNRVANPFQIRGNVHAFLGTAIALKALFEFEFEFIYIP